MCGVLGVSYESWVCGVLGVSYESWVWLQKNIFITFTQLIHCGCKEPLSRPTTELGVGEGFCVFVFLLFVEMQYFIKGPYLGKHN